MSTRLSIYNSEQVFKFLTEYGIKPSAITLMDISYVFIDSKKAGDFFFNTANQVRDTLKNWQAEYRDCDKYSRVVQAIAQMAHALQWDKQKQKPAGLGLGVFNYQREDGGHSINCMLTKNSSTDDFDLKFFEPQESKEVFLTPKEIKSAMNVLL
jgi:hypothetical protein